MARDLGWLGRAWRLSGAAVVLALLLAGTAWGQDSAFPVGPFRMFSTRDDPNGTIKATELVGVTTTGRRVMITGTEIGLRRAEVEGQLDRFVDDPTLMRMVAAAYERRFPHRTLIRVEMLRTERRLRDGRAVDEARSTVLAVWKR